MLDRNNFLEFLHPQAYGTISKALAFLFYTCVYFAVINLGCYFQARRKERNILPGVFQKGIVSEVDDNTFSNVVWLVHVSSVH